MTAKTDTIGRDIPLKEAFVRHFLDGVAEIIPVTRELENLKARNPAFRVVVCAERMVDDVAKMMDKYHQSAKDADSGIHAPLPVILLAFAKDHQPIAPDKGMAVADPHITPLVQGGNWYAMRTDFVERRVQVAFIAHEGESARAMTSQMRLYFLRYGKMRFPVWWHFGGQDFDLTAAVQDLPASDDLADLPDRSNLTVLLWNLTVQYQIPYLFAPEPAKYGQDGKRIGIVPVRQVDLSLNRTDNGVVRSSDSDAVPLHGTWRQGGKR